MIISFFSFLCVFSEGQLQRAVKSALNARRARWICFIIVIIILIVVAIVVAVVVRPPPSRTLLSFPYPIQSDVFPV